LQREQMIGAVLDGLFERTSQIRLLPKWRKGGSRPIQSDACTCRQNESPKQ
jgi:hypothetical protein